jgi:hypothetical protein
MKRFVLMSSFLKAYLAILKPALGIVADKNANILTVGHNAVLNFNEI